MQKLIFLNLTLFSLFSVISCQSRLRRQPEIITSSEFRPPRWAREGHFIKDARFIYLPIKVAPSETQNTTKIRGQNEVRQRSVDLLKSFLKQETLNLTRQHARSLRNKIEENFQTASEPISQHIGHLQFKIEKEYWEQKKADLYDSNGLQKSFFHYTFLVRFEKIDYERMVRTMGDSFQKILSAEEFEEFKVVLFYLLEDDR